MNIEYFAKKADAAAEYNALAMSGIKCVLIGPVDDVTVPTADGTSTSTYNAGGAGGVYVVLSDAEDTVASYDIPKYVPPKDAASGG